MESLPKPTGVRLREAARGLLSQSGTSGTTIRAVANAAGVTPGAVYRHYPSREALIESVVREAVDRLQQGVWKTLARFPVGSHERIIELGRMYIEFAEQNPEDYFVLFGPQPGSRRRLSDALFRRSIDALQQCVADCMESGQFTPGDPKLVAFYLWTRLHGLISVHLTFDLGEDFPGFNVKSGLEAMFMATAELVLAGLAPRAPSAAIAR
jgi:AcrR family transcriptional regulator